jgi:hypothetical protein
MALCFTVLHGLSLRSYSNVYMLLKSRHRLFLPGAVEFLKRHIGRVHEKLILGNVGLKHSFGLGLIPTGDTMLRHV